MRTGYKGFEEKNGKLYCRGMEYKVGEIAEVSGDPIICAHGIHFCWELNDVDDYYSLRESVICEVEPLGDIVAAPDGKKCCTNRLKVIRMLTKEEVWNISNTGSDNTGYINTGNWNTGNCNTGDCNTGNCNTGNRNTGNRNTGNCNTGNRNTGNCNTGSWNTGDRNTGFFNTKENECSIFDEPSGMTPTEFRQSKYYYALCSAPFILTEWIYYTDEEKAEDKAKELIGGYLKRYDYKEACAKWWTMLSDKNKAIIQQIPNFDADKFEEITGIKV